MNRDDRGSAAILVLGLVAVVMIGASAAATLGAAVAVRHQVAAQADLAALAAARAGWQQAGPPGPCGRGARVAAELVVGSGAADVESCAQAGDGSVTVTVARPAPGVLATLTRVRVAARAGPVVDGPVVGG